MNAEHIWMMYFATIAGIRHHPKNMPEPTPANSQQELEFAYDIANRMLEMHKQDRWPSCQ